MDLDPGIFGDVCLVLPFDVSVVPGLRENGPEGFARQKPTTSAVLRPDTPLLLVRPRLLGFGTRFLHFMSELPKSAISDGYSYIELTL